MLKYSASKGRDFCYSHAFGIFKQASKPSNFQEFRYPPDSTLPQPSLTPTTPHYLNHHSHRKL
ncbi:MAG: hypothetical protein L0922_04615, partial [Candidatus Mariimomonas ferrooxydans]